MTVPTIQQMFAESKTNSNLDHIDRSSYVEPQQIGKLKPTKHVQEKVDKNFKETLSSILLSKHAEAEKENQKKQKTHKKYYRVIFMHTAVHLLIPFINADWIWQGMLHLWTGISCAAMCVG